MNRKQRNSPERRRNSVMHLIIPSIKLLDLAKNSGVDDHAVDRSYPRMSRNVGDRRKRWPTKALTRTIKEEVRPISSKKNFPVWRCSFLIAKGRCHDNVALLIV